MLDQSKHVVSDFHNSKPKQNNVLFSAMHDFAFFTKLCLWHVVGAEVDVKPQKRRARTRRRLADVINEKRARLVV